MPDHDRIVQALLGDEAHLRELYRSSPSFQMGVQHLAAMLPAMVDGLALHGIASDDHHTRATQAARIAMPHGIVMDEATLRRLGMNADESGGFRAARGPVTFSTTFPDAPTLEQFPPPGFQGWLCGGTGETPALKEDESGIGPSAATCPTCDQDVKPTAAGRVPPHARV